MASGLKLLISLGNINQSHQAYSHDEIVKKPIYNFSNSRSDVVVINGDIRIHGKSSTIFIASSSERGLHSWTLMPYPRKADVSAMQRVRNWTMKFQVAAKLPDCIRKFSIPAVLFSTGGFSGNPYHDFSDLLIPLYLTARPFNQTLLFLVTDSHRSWISKFKPILERLSKHDVINIDKRDQVLCFARTTIGLKAHDEELSLNPSQFPYYSIKHFRQFLQTTYSLERTSINDRLRSTRPRMLIISRKNTRVFKNEGEVAKLGKNLGFDVVVGDIPCNMGIVAKFVNSLDVMVGVHGAGLTNMVFLPDNAVLIQIIPLGLESSAKRYYEFPTKEMTLRYLGYKVSVNESSLFGKYPADSEVYRDPGAVRSRGYLRFRSIYMDNQDVNIDLARFKDTLLNALQLVRN
ncbi:protein O-linked-mannose beta-1,4-N-acetylglucosaminyltransferase 2-like [Sesamum indicum]|uniref:Protein O-linked-mannose beta-1,4-N-acetylglucosaminyltransferase 2-like n=1 Tax=Sesamum indicum TaxID=4182 RepID=A0A6I9SUG8_SESIN|nr:protein O-linked-mannose beta-1,4-N-acetylglucosaminyltransferase 2-like [Sesamum indicum]